MNVWKELREFKPVPWKPPRDAAVRSIADRCSQCGTGVWPFETRFIGPELARAFYQCSDCGTTWGSSWDPSYITRVNDAR
jgi:hypothetical protein